MLQRKRTVDDITEKFVLLTATVRDHIKEMYLFGSRCREDWRPDSDYDIMIVMDKKDRAVVSRLYDAVLDILLETGRLISLKIFSEAEFQRLKAIPTPFMQNVLGEGIKLGTGN